VGFASLISASFWLFSSPSLPAGGLVAGREGAGGVRAFQIDPGGRKRLEAAGSGRVRHRRAKRWEGGAVPEGTRNWAE